MKIITIKVIVKSMLLFNCIILLWQAMYEFYRFEEADVIVALFLLTAGFLSLCIYNYLLETKK